MTSLLPRSVTARPDGTGGGADRPSAARPLPLVAVLGGGAAAAATLGCCLLVALAGWFLTDAGAHGEPRDALRVGAQGWLVGHGSQVTVRGTVVGVLPLGVTLLFAWVTWRVGHRVGDVLSGHGPDADRIADGERDWTVPAATALFCGGYVVTLVLAAAVAADPTTLPATGRAVGGALLLSGLLGGAAVSVGSGRAAIWLALLPPPVRRALATARAVLVAQAAAAALLLLGALALDLGGVLEVFSRLGADAGDAVLLVVLTVLVLPNALLFAGAWLLGPGFTVGTGTIVSPSATVLGALPLLPLAPALPAEGALPRGVALAVVAVPFVVSALAAARRQAAAPTLRWDDGVLGGCVGGVLAGVVLGVLAGLAGGALGPGRMADVGPVAGEVLLHSVAALGLGGALGGALATAGQRRRARRSGQ